jgi:hypothetical protein
LKKRPTFRLRTSCFQPSYHQAYHRQSQERTGRRRANQILSLNSIPSWSQLTNLIPSSLSLPYRASGLYSLLAFILLLVPLAACLLAWRRDEEQDSCKKKIKTGSQLGLPGSTGFRVDRDLLGQIPSCFYLDPARFQARVGWVPDRPTEPGQDSKLWLQRFER